MYLHMYLCSTQVSHYKHSSVPPLLHHRKPSKLAPAGPSEERGAQAASALDAAAQLHTYKTKKALSHSRATQLGPSQRCGSALQICSWFWFNTVAAHVVKTLYISRSFNLPG